MGLGARLQAVLAKPTRLVVGLISGTSLDGVDAALVEITNHGTETQVRPCHFRTYPYHLNIREQLLQCSQAGRGAVDEICRLNTLVAEVFSRAVFDLLAEADVDPGEVDLIGSHGQTVHHLPQEEVHSGFRIRSTLQLGDGSWIAKRTGIPTIADFRQADMALGGQGAPLVPYFDYLMFRDHHKSRIILNIGGIANLTILPKGCGVEDVVAFDTGPGNMVVDGLMKSIFDKPFDEAGAVANSGTISTQLLDSCLKHDYFLSLPPKSTGREDFGEIYLLEFQKAAGKLDLSKQDIIATATALTVRGIVDSLQRFGRADLEIDEVIVSGGGLYNARMMTGLVEEMAPAKVLPIDDFGIAGEAKEAICFAVLANETVAGNPSNVPTATGARERTILGKICL